MIRPPTCPVCDRELSPADITESAVFPFCSKRCKQIDLLRWCKGDYAIVEELTPSELFRRLEGESADPHKEP